MQIFWALLMLVAAGTMITVGLLLGRRGDELEESTFRSGPWWGGR